MGFPGLKRAPLLCEPVVSVIVRGVHIGLCVRENSEAVLTRNAERREARRNASSKIVRRRVGASNSLDVRKPLDDPAKRLREAVTRDRSFVCESRRKQMLLPLYRSIKLRPYNLQRQRRERNNVGARPFHARSGNFKTGADAVVEVGKLRNRCAGG